MTALDHRESVPLLEVRDLRTAFRTDRGLVRADTVHPTEVGAAFIADAFVTALFDSLSG